MPGRSMVELENISGGSMQNAMRFLTDPSRRSFFLLGIGENTIRFGASSGVGGLTATLTYSPRYLGTF